MWKRFKWYDLIFVALLVIHIFLRFEFSEYPLAIDGGDGSRDYMVAHLIATHHEYPLAGPSNGVFEFFRNSPVYYYVLSLPLFLYDDIYTFVIYHIFLESLLVVFIYLLSRNMFGGLAGILSAALFSFTQLFLADNTFVWQPHVMAVIVYGSFFCLLSAYQRKSYALLLSSSLLITLAVAVHNAAVAFLVPFVFVAWWMSGEIGISIAKRLWVMFLSFSLLVFLYAPTIAVLFALYSFNPGSLIGNESSLLGIPQRMLVQVYLFFGQIISYFGLNHRDWFYANDFLLFITTLSTAWYFFVSKTQGERRYATILASFFAFYVFVTSALNLSGETHYVQPSFGIIAILVGMVLTRALFQHKRFAPVAGLVLGVLFLFSGSSVALISKWQSREQRPTNAQVMDEALSAVASTILQIQDSEGYTNPDFFRVYGLRSGSYKVKNAVLLIPLEKRLGYRLTEIDDSYGDYNYREINSDDYMFVFCISHKGVNYPDSKCMKAFGDLQESQYRVLNRVYASEIMSVFLAKKSSL